ncbi:MAG: phage tail protein [Pseudoxanthomonas sp.]
MTASRTPAYRFSTAAHWATCLVAGAAEIDPRAPSIAPLPRYASAPSRSLPSSGARAVALAAGGECAWRDDAGKLHRAMLDDEVDEILVAPLPLANTPRIVAGADAWWAFDPGRGTVAAFERESLARRFELELPRWNVVDLALSGRDGVCALLERDGRHALVRIDRHGTQVGQDGLQATGFPTALAALPGLRRVLLLAGAGTLLHLIEADAAIPVASVQLGSLRPCFRATTICSDGRNRWIVVGSDGADFGGGAHALVLDRDGALLDAVALKLPASGVAADASMLLIANAHGIDVHPQVRAAGPQSSAECQVLTPLLRAPEGHGSRWMRAQASVLVPEGASAEISVAEVADPELRARVEKLLGDHSLSNARKLRRLQEAGLAWNAPIVLQGRAASEPILLAAPMHDVSAQEVIVRTVLRATPRAVLPQLQGLEVLYAAPGLVERLPMVYRRSMEQPGDYLRSLVGVLEATTQQADARIATLGSLIDADSAPAPWLDSIARWLGLPWDDALDEDRKRCIVRHAAALAAARGTRAGLALLLECLFPGAPPRFRIVDVEVDVGFARLGGQCCAGPALPTLLTGLPRRASVLSRRTRLGVARLPCPGRDEDPLAPWRGALRIEIAADALERRQAQPWLAGVLASMVTATARVALRWRLPGAPDDVLTEAGQPLLASTTARLGAGAVTRLARLPETQSSTLR